MNYISLSSWENDIKLSKSLLKSFSDRIWQKKKILSQVFFDIFFLKDFLWFQDWTDAWGEKGVTEVEA